MAVHVQFYDNTGFKLGDYGYPDNKVGTERFEAAAKRLLAPETPQGAELFHAVALVQDGKEVKRVSLKKAAD